MYTNEKMKGVRQLRAQTGLAQGTLSSTLFRDANEILNLVSS